MRHDLRPSPALPGPAGQKKIAADFRRAFSDLRMTLDLVLAEGDLVAARWTTTGTHSGSWGGVEPTGRAVTFSGVNIFRFTERQGRGALEPPRRSRADAAGRRSDLRRQRSGQIAVRGRSDRQRSPPLLRGARRGGPDAACSRDVQLRDRLGLVRRRAGRSRACHRLRPTRLHAKRATGTVRADHGLPARGRRGIAPRGARRVARGCRRPKLWRRDRPGRRAQVPGSRASPGLAGTSPVRALAGSSTVGASPARARKGGGDPGDRGASPGAVST